MCYLFIINLLYAKTIDYCITSAKSFQIRKFITVVSQYTNSKVDIIAYSMGVAISRKAILGGNCVDTNYDLGEKISRLVNVYIGVAGVAYGFQDCPNRTKVLKYMI